MKLFPETLLKMTAIGLSLGVCRSLPDCSIVDSFSSAKEVGFGLGARASAVMRDQHDQVPVLRKAQLCPRILLELHRVYRGAAGIGQQVQPHVDNGRAGGGIA